MAENTRRNRCLTYLLNKAEKDGYNNIFMLLIAVKLTKISYNKAYKDV
jgi:hypothetical protein